MTNTIESISIDRMQELLEEFSCVSKKVFKFNGKMSELVKLLIDRGIEILRDENMGEIYNPASDIQLYEVPEYNCILIGEWRDIDHFLENKEKYFGVVFEKLECWVSSRANSPRTFVKSGHQQ